MPNENTEFIIKNTTPQEQKQKSECHAAGNHPHY